MTTVDINDFSNEKECIYDDERYRVRDNGAVFRYPRVGGHVRANDNKWTFGKTNSNNPYLHISSARVHRVVATAFHGDPPDPKYVVDHVDSNCRNNRPENLRWLTRLENALLNPVTRKKIEFLCGSVEAFLEDPSILHSYKIESNYDWMRTVTKEEAQNCKRRMSLWVDSGKKPTGGTLGEWVYKPIKNYSVPLKGSTLGFRTENTYIGGNQRNNLSDEYFAKRPNTEKSNTENVQKSILSVLSDDDLYELEGLTIALTPNCIQRKWRVPSHFPCCPKEMGTSPLETYARNLKPRSVFSHNAAYPSSIVEFANSKDNQSILVLCERKGMKPWAIAEITYEEGLFVHTNRGSYFTKDGADKEFQIGQELEWYRGDTFDDFC